MSELFPTAVYLLCFLTSSACAYLLARSYARTRARLLLWSALCFLFLAANNLAVVVDLLVLPQFNFSLLRIVLSLAAVGVLLFGLVWDLEERR
jgi:hypothetical protein